MLGTGWIAHEMGEALKRVNGEIYACCATSMESAEKYAEEFDVKNAYGSADEMFDDENIDIVYIATPHNSHYEFLMKALQSGKHVFCEKAITVNDTQLEATNDKPINQFWKDKLTDVLIHSVKADDGIDRKSTRLNSSHLEQSRMPSSA